MKKLYAGASSTGWPARPAGVSDPNDSTMSSGMVAGISGVQTGPGATSLTRLPLSASFWPNALVNATMPALVVAQSSSADEGWYAWIKDVLMIVDPASYAARRLC